MIWLWVLVLTIPLSDQPVWESVSGFYSTGGGFADMNGDGYPDLFVANGNDMAAQPNHVFVNDGGTLQSLPTWGSQDLQYSGHLAVGDLNQDGWPDLVVANYSGYTVGWPPQLSVVYLNEGGTLSPTPSWVPADSFRSFSCALGDYDNDGDLDVVFAAGERYSQHPDVLRLYRNLTQEPDSGLLTSIPVWTSAQAYYAYDVTFADLNRDGWLDLVVAVDGGGNMVFLNEQGSFSTTPSWTSADAYGTIQIAVADVDRDGWPDLAAADNGQLGGISRFRLYRNLQGTLEAQASWVSGETRTYCSTVAFADLNADGYPELAGGGWWEPVVVYENLQGDLFPVASWSYLTPNSNNLVCEHITFADVDLHALLTVEETLEIWAGRPAFGAWPLRHFPVHSVLEVLAQNVQTGVWDTLSPSQWTLLAESGWITIADPGYPVSMYRIRYQSSRAVDLLVTNWAPGAGNFLFENTLVAVEERRGTDRPNPREPVVFPNPTPGPLSILTHEDLRQIEVLDRVGRIVPVIMGSFKKGNVHVTLPKDLPQGIYILRIHTPTKTYRLPVILLR